MDAVQVQVRGTVNRKTRAESDSLGRLPVCCQCQIFLHVILAWTYVYILEMVSKVSNNNKFSLVQEILQSNLRKIILFIYSKALIKPIYCMTTRTSDAYFASVSSGRITGACWLDPHPPTEFYRITKGIYSHNN